MREINRDRKYVLGLLLFSFILFSFSLIHTRSLPTLDVTLINPPADQNKPINKKIEYTFQINSGGQGVNGAQAILKVDGKTVDTGTSKSSGKVTLDFKRRNTSPFEIKLEASKPGYENTTLTLDIRNYYSVSTNPKPGTFYTHETLIISSIFKRNNAGWEGITAKLYLNNQYHSETATTVSGVSSFTIEQPTYGENYYYLEYNLNGATHQTEFTTFTFTKELSVSLRSIDQSNFTDYNTPLIHLESNVYSHNIPQEGVQLDYYINDILYQTILSDSQGSGSITYQMNPGETISWYVIASKLNYLTDLSITKKYHVEQPNVSVELVSPIDNKHVLNHTSSVPLQVYVLVNSLPEPNAETQFFVNNQFVSSTQSNENGIATIDFIPEVENASFNWYAITETSHGLVSNSSIFMFHTPLLDPDIHITEFYKQSERLSIGFESIIGFKLQWENGTILSDTSIILENGAASVTNIDGWVFFPVFSNQIMKKTYRIAAIPNTVYNRIVLETDSSVIWDTITISLEQSKTRHNVGEQANLLIDSKYAYDNSPFSGEIQFNTDPVLNHVGHKEIYAESIHDFTHNLESFETNILTVIWDTVSLNLIENDSRLLQNIDYVPNVQAFYLYDNSEFQGTYTLSDFSTNNIGETTIEISSISDTQYGLTSFTSNIVPLKVDKITIDTSYISTIPGKITLEIIAYYQSDNQPISNLEIKLGEHVVPCVSEGQYSITLDTLNLRISETLHVSSNNDAILVEITQPLLFGNIFVSLSIIATSIGGAYNYHQSQQKKKIFESLLISIQDSTHFIIENLPLNDQNTIESFLNQLVEEKNFIESYSNNHFTSVSYLQSYYNETNPDNIRHYLEIAEITHIKTQRIDFNILSDVTTSKIQVNSLTKSKLSLYEQTIPTIDQIVHIELYSANITHELEIANKNDTVGFYLLDRTPHMNVYGDLTQEAKMLMSRKLFSTRNYLTIDDNVFTVIPQEYRINDIFLVESKCELTVNETRIERGASFYDLPHPKVETIDVHQIEKVKIKENHLGPITGLKEIQITKTRFLNRIKITHIHTIDHLIQLDVQLNEKNHQLGEYFLRTALDDPTTISPFMAPHLFPALNYTQIEDGVYKKPNPEKVTIEHKTRTSELAENAFDENQLPDHIAPITVSIQEKTTQMGEYFLKEALDDPTHFSPLMAPKLFPNQQIKQIDEGVYKNDTQSHQPIHINDNMQTETIQKASIPHLNDEGNKPTPLKPSKLSTIERKQPTPSKPLPKISTNQDPNILSLSPKDTTPRPYAGKNLSDLTQLLQNNDDEIASNALIELIRRGPMAADYLQFEYYYKNHPYDWRIIVVIGYIGTEKHLSFLNRLKEDSDPVTSSHAKKAEALIKSRLK